MNIVYDLVWSQVWWCTPIILTFGTLKQVGQSSPLSWTLVKYGKCLRNRQKVHFMNSIKEKLSHSGNWKTMSDENHIWPPRNFVSELFVCRGVVLVLSGMQVGLLPVLSKSVFSIPFLFPRWPIFKVTHFQIINKNVLKCLFVFLQTFCFLIPSTLEESFSFNYQFSWLEDF